VHIKSLHIIIIIISIIISKVIADYEYLRSDKCTNIENPVILTNIYGH